MEKYKTIFNQYCPVVLKNVAIEKRLQADDSEVYECMNILNCNCCDGKCENKLLSEYNIVGK